MHTQLPASLPVVEKWYDTEQISAVLTRITEPYTKPLLAANTWFIEGNHSDLFVDCGLGVASLRQELPQYFNRNPALLATHGHLDHMGSAHEFEEIWVHSLEDIQSTGRGTLNPHQLAGLLGAPNGSFGSDVLIDALPKTDYDHRTYQLHPTKPTQSLSDADRIELGGINLTVLHLPGHTPGSISLWEPDRRWLFTGDVIYDDGSDMIDYFAESSPSDYRASMRKLLSLNVDRVFAGHGPVFDGERLHELAERYLSLDEDSPRLNTYN